MDALGHIAELTDNKRPAASARSMAPNVEGIVIVTDEGQICYANSAAERFFLADHGALTGTLFGYPIVGGDSARIEVFLADRSKAIAEMHCIPFVWEERPVHLVTIRPVRKSGRGDSIVQKSTELLHALVAGSPMAIIATDMAGRVTLWNHAATAVLGWNDRETLGNPLPVTAADDGGSLASIWDQAAHGSHVIGRELIEQQTRDGHEVAFQVWAARMHDDRGLPSGMMLMLSDVTEQRRAEAHIRRLVGHDALTGLPNRRQFRKQLQRVLGKLGGRDRLPVMVLQLGIDRFKNINKSIGHAGGDRLLQAVSHRLAAALYETDLLARTGGDEFSILLRDTHHLHDGARVANKLLEHFSTPFDVNGQELFITASIGIAVHPHDGKKAEDLIHAADDAMDRAKDRGGNGCQFFTPDIDSNARSQLMLENGLRHALERGELFLQYQPQFELASGRMKGVEALLRWRHFAMGVVPPGNFIPVAESSGLIVPIGAWVINAACEQLRAWDAAGLPTLRVAVNVSTRQFYDEGFKAEVQRALCEHDIAPERLELELTESMLVRNATGAIEVLRDLKALGVSLSIDDFGTGYSGLSYLVDLPVDTLKVDQSFVRRLGEGPCYGAIVTAVVELARGLHLRVVAEGVETEAQLDFLRKTGCDEVQGYLLSRPVDPPGIARLQAQAYGFRSHHRATPA